MPRTYLSKTRCGMSHGEMDRRLAQHLSQGDPHKMRLMLKLPLFQVATGMGLDAATANWIAQSAWEASPPVRINPRAPVAYSAM